MVRFDEEEPSGAPISVRDRDGEIVWSIDIISSYPVPNGYGDREAIAMGAVG